MAFNAQGNSPHSSPLTVYVGEAVPTGEPQNIKVLPLSPTEIRISWQPPMEKDQNGELLGYKIFYQKKRQQDDTPKTGRKSRQERGNKVNLSGALNNKFAEEVEVVGPKMTSFELLYLDMYTEYIITMLCFNPAGEGPRSEPIIVRTKESLPGPVANLRFTDITMNSLKVVWDEPLKPNGRLQGYLVTYETARPDESEYFHFVTMGVNCKMHLVMENNRYQLHE